LDARYQAGPPGRWWKITSLEQIFLFSLPIKEHQIVEQFLPSPGTLKDEVMKIMPVQKQTRAGQRTRFKAFVAVGDDNGHVGLGVKCSKEVATAIRGAIILAKISIVPVRRGYWGSNIGKPHTVPCKVSGKCGSVHVRLIPAPKGTGLVAAPASKKLLGMAGLSDCYTSSRGQTKTMGNFVKATFDALNQTYSYLMPNLWTQMHFLHLPYAAHSDFLAQPKKARRIGGPDDRERRDRRPGGRDGDRRPGGDRGDRGGDRSGPRAPRAPRGDFGGAGAGAPPAGAPPV